MRSALSLLTPHCVYIYTAYFIVCRRGDDIRLSALFPQLEIQAIPPHTHSLGRHVCHRMTFALSRPTSLLLYGICVSVGAFLRLGYIYISVISTNHGIICPEHAAKWYLK